MYIPLKEPLPPGNPPPVCPACMGAKYVRIEGKSVLCLQCRGSAVANLIKK